MSLFTAVDPFSHAPRSWQSRPRDAIHQFLQISFSHLFMQLTVFHAKTISFVSNLKVTNYLPFAFLPPFETIAFLPFLPPFELSLIKSIL